MISKFNQPVVVNDTWVSSVQVYEGKNQEVGRVPEALAVSWTRRWLAPSSTG